MFIERLADANLWPHKSVMLSLHIPYSLHASNVFNTLSPTVFSDFISPFLIFLLHTLRCNAAPSTSPASPLPLLLRAAQRERNTTEEYRRVN